MSGARRSLRILPVGDKPATSTTGTEPIQLREEPVLALRGETARQFLEGVDRLAVPHEPHHVPRDAAGHVDQAIMPASLPGEGGQGGRGSPECPVRLRIWKSIASGLIASPSAEASQFGPRFPDGRSVWRRGRGRVLQAEDDHVDLQLNDPPRNPACTPVRRWLTGKTPADPDGPHRRFAQGDEDAGQEQQRQDDGVDNRQRRVGVRNGPEIANPSAQNAAAPTARTTIVCTNAIPDGMPAL